MTWSIMRVRTLCHSSINVEVLYIILERKYGELTVAMVETAAMMSRRIFMDK